MTEQLKPCPFCGAQPELQQVGNYATKKRGFQVVCNTWGCQAKWVCLTISSPLEKAREWAIAAWNRRADHSPDAGEMVRIARPAPVLAFENCDIFTGADGENSMYFRFVEGTTHLGNLIIVAQNNPKAAEVLALLNSVRSPDTGKVVQPEPPADLVEQIADVIRDNMMDDGLIGGPTFIARAIHALLQPRLEAAEMLLAAGETARSAALGYVSVKSAVDALDNAIAAAKAAGIGGEK